MQAAEPTDHHVDLAAVDLHCFLRDGEACEVSYYADDGLTWDYQRGQRTTWRAHIKAEAGQITVTDVHCDNAWQALQLRLVVYGAQTVVNGQAVEAYTWKATGESLSLGLVVL